MSAPRKGTAPVKEKEDKKPLPRVEGGGEQLSDAQLKEQSRAYIPSAIIRLAALCNSNNEAISLGAIKTLLAKNMPDLKATDLTSLGDKIERIDLVTLLQKAYGTNTPTPEMSNDSE